MARTGLSIGPQIERLSQGVNDPRMTAEAFRQVQDEAYRISRLVNSILTGRVSTPVISDDSTVTINGIAVTY